LSQEEKDPKVESPTDAPTRETSKTQRTGNSKLKPQQQTRS